MSAFAAAPLPWLLISALALTGGLDVRAQDHQAEAARHFAEGDWERAAAAYETVVEAEPENRMAWFRWGQALQRSGAYAEAEATYTHLDTMGTSPFVTYNLAVVQALQERHATAFETLERAVQGGYSNADQLTGEAAFAPLRSDDRFADLLVLADRNARPCAYSEPHRQFDFWLGTWDVTNPQGQPAGVNRIEEAENGCLLVESWTGASGGSGTSINYYDPASEQWVQQWVAAGGSVIRLKGGLQPDGTMRLTGEMVAFDGERTPLRGIWTPLPDGRVRQQFEQSADGGATWTTGFDGIYTKREEP